MTNEQAEVEEFVKKETERGRDQTWQPEVYEQGSASLAEANTLIKELRMMLDAQQAFISKMLGNLRTVSEERDELKFESVMDSWERTGDKDKDKLLAEKDKLIMKANSAFDHSQQIILELNERNTDLEERLSKVSEELNELVGW